MSVWGLELVSAPYIVGREEGERKFFLPFTPPSFVVSGLFETTVYKNAPNYMFIDVFVSSNRQPSGSIRHTGVTTKLTTSLEE